MNYKAEVQEEGALVCPSLLGCQRVRARVLWRVTRSLWPSSREGAKADDIMGSGTRVGAWMSSLGCFMLYSTKQTSIVLGKVTKSLYLMSQYTTIYLPVYLTFNRCYRRSNDRG